MTNEVGILVDVRLNQISKKTGLSKTAFAQELNEAGFEYRHDRHLGNPKENRNPSRPGLKSVRENYRRHLRSGASSAYGGLIELAATSRIALLE